MRAKHRTTLPTDYRLSPTVLRRPGISLLEVLICIGVVAIGLVSIAALIPVGGLQVQRANTEERKGTLGLNAFREFQIRGMDKIENWVRYKSPNWVNYENSTPPLDLTAQINPPVSGFPDFVYLPPFAIDPLMVGIGQAAGTSAAVSTFPANYSGGPIMPRLTVAGTSSYDSFSGYYTPLRPISDAIFTAADDVVANLPDDTSQIGTSALDSTNNKRDFNGAFTWLATITSSRPTLVGGSASFAKLYQPQPSDQCTLSIVVFDRRVLSTPVAANVNGGQEEMVQAHWPNLNPGADTTLAAGGGEFTLVDSSANAASKLAMARPEQWLMLCRYVPLTYLVSATDTVSYPWLEAKWYRIVAVGAITQSGSTYSLQVTLDGDDWSPDPTPAVAPTAVTWPTSVPPAAQNYNTYACLFDGAVGVFQKIIHLQSPSNWGP